MSNSCAWRCRMRRLRRASSSSSVRQSEKSTSAAWSTDTLDLARDRWGGHAPGRGSARRGPRRSSTIDLGMRFSITTWPSVRGARRSPWDGSGWTWTCRVLLSGGPRSGRAVDHDTIIVGHARMAASRPTTALLGGSPATSSTGSWRSRPATASACWALGCWRCEARSSGEWRTTPVNLLELGGRRYLVSPRGEGHWVRNLRAAGEGQLRIGRKAEAFRARELDDREKVPVLRAYLERWKVEVGIFFEGVGPKSTDEQLDRDLVPPSGVRGPSHRRSLRAQCLGAQAECGCDRSRSPRHRGVDHGRLRHHGSVLPH